MVARSGHLVVGVEAIDVMSRHVQEGQRRVQDAMWLDRLHDHHDVVLDEQFGTWWMAIAPAGETGTGEEIERWVLAMHVGSELGQVRVLLIANRVPNDSLAHSEEVHVIDERRPVRFVLTLGEQEIGQRGTRRQRIEHWDRRSGAKRSEICIFGWDRDPGYRIVSEKRIDRFEII